MKKIFLAFAAVACMLCSCSDDKTDDSRESDRISISGEGVVSIGPDGGAVDLTITSSGDWRVTGLCEWARISAVAGKNGEVVTLTVDPNDTGVFRETIFKFFTGGSIAELKVSSQVDYTLDLQSAAEVNFDRNANNLTVTLKTNIPELTCAYSDGGSEWIKFNLRSDGFGSTFMSFNVLANETYEDRSSTITISGVDVEPIEVTVRQKQTDVIIIEKLSHTFGLEGGSLSIDVKSNIEYMVEIPAKYTWLQYQAPASRAMTGTTENFTIEQATGLRSGKINFKAKNSSYTVAVEVIQRGEELIYATIPDANFRTWLIDNDYAVGIDGAKCALTEGGLNATSLDCRNKKISSLEGLDAFTKLTSLDARNNPLKKLPLNDLDITTLNLSGGSIVDLAISSSKLTMLNISNNTYSLTTLDVSECPLLTDLNVYFNFYLSTIYVKPGHIFTKITDGYAGIYTDSGRYQIIEK